MVNVFKPRTVFRAICTFVILLGATIFLNPLQVYASGVTDPSDFDSWFTPIGDYVPDNCTEEDVMLELNEEEESGQTIISNPPAGEEVTALPSTSVADAVFFRYLASGSGCMQNFSVFKKDGISYLVRSMGGGVHGEANVFIQKRSPSNAMAYDTIVSKDANNPNLTSKTYNGHGTSVEIVEYDDKLYLLYIGAMKHDTGEFNENNEPIYTTNGDCGLIGTELVFGSDGYIYWGTEYRMGLFRDYNDVPLFSCKVATSDNYLCLASSYGTTLKNDRERYIVYDKEEFMAAFIDGSNSQHFSAQNDSAVQASRMATGMFPANQSIGMIVPFKQTVIQSVALDEKKDDNGILTDFIVLAAIDDRGQGKKEVNHEGRKTHLITRAFLTPKTKGSSASRATQNMANNTCYYSKVTHLGYEGVSTNLQHALNSAPSNLAYQRTELEGLKKIKSQGNGITGGWYLSTHNSRFIGRSALAGIIPINGSMPDYTSGQIPWNMMIYKPHMTPVASWN